MTKIIAVKPHIYKDGINFKLKPGEAWRALGGKTTNGWYPRWLHWLMFKVDMPTLCRVGAPRLCFVEAQSVTFDTFFAGMTHEVIPFIWDCWPQHYDKMEHWLRKHKVRTAIFTSRQEMEEMQSRIKELKTIWCPEGIDADSYKAGKPLKERSIDYLSYGRCSKMFDVKRLDRDIKVMTSDWQKELKTQSDLADALADSKIVLCLSKFYTNPDTAQGVDTLTQRFWECLLSGVVVIGHAPQELVDLMGYNPMVELTATNDGEYDEQIHDILAHIEDYQPLVDKNRELALKMAPWKIRINEIVNSFQIR